MFRAIGSCRVEHICSCSERRQWVLFEAIYLLHAVYGLTPCMDPCSQGFHHKLFYLTRSVDHFLPVVSSKT